MKEYQEHGDNTQVAGIIPYDKNLLPAPSNFAWSGRSGYYFNFIIGNSFSNSTFPTKIRIQRCSY